MSWHSSVRSLLRDLRRSNTSTPSERQLEQLHIEAYNSDGEIAWANMQAVGGVVGGRKGRSSTFLMDLALRDATTARFCSEYVSSVLFGWITVLSQQTTEEIQVSR